MTAGILIIHTPAQLDEASTLVDLLEASLALPSGAIACSSLPGYAWAAHNAPAAEQRAGFSQALEDAYAAIALVDDQACGDAQLWFDLAAAWARGKRVAVLADHGERRAQIPLQLDGGEVIERVDRGALVGLLEDLAFQFGVRPRIGADAQRALQQLSSAPPPAAKREVPTVRPPKAEAKAEAATNGAGQSHYEEIESVPPPPGVPSELRAEAEATEPDVTRPVIEPDILIAEQALRSAAVMTDPSPALRGGAVMTDPSPALRGGAVMTDPSPALRGGVVVELPAEDLLPPPLDDEPYELGDGDFEPLRGFEPELAPISCQLSLEAGRAISECSFHREEGGDFGDELERSFGSFIDAVGGNWLELKRIGDIEVWLGATDNLLEALPEREKYAAEWYEMGFQFATLHSLAAQGVPDDPEQLAVFQELWDQSMAAFCGAAESAQVVARERRRQQALLENLIGPEQRRDYSNVSRSLDELRGLAQAADRA